MIIKIHKRSINELYPLRKEALVLDYYILLPSTKHQDLW